MPLLRAFTQSRELTESYWRGTLQGLSVHRHVWEERFPRQYWPEILSWQKRQQSGIKISLEVTTTWSCSVTKPTCPGQIQTHILLSVRQMRQSWRLPVNWISNA